VNIKNYLPHQKEFATSKERYTAIVGGYRSGKTRAIIYKYIHLSVKRKGKVKLLIIAPTYRLLRDVDLPLFTEYFDEKGINYKLIKSDLKIKVNDYVCGEIIFRSGDNPQKIVGFEVTDFIIDEFDIIRKADQKDLWVKALARISGSKNGTGSIVTTPEGYKHTYELFVEKKIGKLIKAKTTDNHYLPEDYIQSLFDNYDSQLIEQYINGEFVNINNQPAYYEFNREYIIDNYKPQKNEILVGIDFNVDPLTAVISEQIQDELIIFDEFYLRNSNTFRLVEVLKEKYPNKTITAFPDMTGKARKTSASLSDIQILQKAGIKIQGIRNPRVKNRIAGVNNAFDKNKIRITKNCKYLIRDLEQVGIDNYGEIDKSSQDLSHISDAFGYLVFRKYPLKTPPKWGVSSF